MINLVLEFIRTNLHNFLKSGDETTETVVYPNIEPDPPSFISNAINFFLINIEEESILRRADPFVQIDKDGNKRNAKPPLRINIFFLLAAKYSAYPEALKNLSRALSFFQANPVFTPQSHPDLPTGLDKLIIELTPLTYAQQNEIWGSLKKSALPSVCYMARMIIIEEPAIDADSTIKEVTTMLKNL